MNIEILERLNEDLSDKSAQEILKYVSENYKGKVAFSSSLGAEDQVLTEMIANHAADINIFTLDTGRLFPETLDLLEVTVSKYDVPIQVYFPDAKQVEEMVNSKGINLFIQSVESRKLCCYVRKTQPLKRALKGMEVWITGIRKDQSVTRFFNKVVEFDKENNILKVNPLLKWTEKDVWNYIRENDIPYNELHDKGFPSIGCRPCTRAIEPGEDIRAGRWWWEEPEHKECGLHNRPEKK